MAVPLKQGDGAYPVYLVDASGVLIGTLSAPLVTAPSAGGGAAITAVAVTIQSGASLSAAVDLASLGVAQIVMSAAWTTASLTFQISIDGSAYQDLYDAYGVEYTVVAVAAHTIVVSPADFVGFRFLKVRSGTAGVPVVQGATRVLALNTRAF